MESKPGSLFPGQREPRKGRNHTEGNATTPLRKPTRPRIQTPKIYSVCRRLPLGFIGPLTEAEEIKERITTFLRTALKLTLSAAKTLITHAHSGKARFL